ncbi:MAG: hypothetical protein H6633_02705 [Anaerolineales bacterium]|nr:hypothetical protein [Anaerolineales bacterium]
MVLLKYLGIAIVVFGGIWLAIYIVRQVSRAGQQTLAHPEIQSWLQKEKVLETHGEWRAASDISLVLPDFEFDGLSNSSEAEPVDIVVALCPQVGAPLKLASPADYIGQAWEWLVQYQNLDGCSRVDLIPADGGPTLAVLEVHDSSGGIVAQVGQQGYIVFQPDLLPERPATSPPGLVNIATVEGTTVTFQDRRTFYWKPSDNIYGLRYFTNTQGDNIITFQLLNVQVSHEAPLDVVSVLILLEYYLYANPTGD